MLVVGSFQDASSILAASTIFQCSTRTRLRLVRGFGEDDTSHLPSCLVGSEW